MKLDKELVREVLLKLEADESDPLAWKDLEITGWPGEQVAYTVCILAEGGLIEAEDLSSHSGFDWRPIRLTFAGHEYVDTVRDGEVWKTKEVAQKAGAYSLQALLEAAKTVIKGKMAQHGLPHL